eukprot:scaffold572275_cov22-Prasinocladus_malaysianus.AAC.1
MDWCVLRAPQGRLPAALRDSSGDHGWEVGYSAGHGNTQIDGNGASPPAQPGGPSQAGKPYMQLKQMFLANSSRYM